MQTFRLTSRSISKDPFYQSEQEKLQKIHLHKLRMITSTQLKPLKTDSTIKLRFRKAKSMAKIFQKEETIINQRRENHSLLKKLMNVESTLKPLRIKQIHLNQKLYGTASNWTQRKKEEQNVKKQSQLIAKKCDSITNVDLKDIKKKMQDEIKEYLELRESIRKMNPPRTSEPNERQKNSYGNKIIIYQPKNTDSNVEGTKNPQQNSQSSNQSTKKNIQIINDSKIQFLKRQALITDESPKKDPFAEVKKLRQLKKSSQEYLERRNLQKKEKSVKKLYAGSDKLVRKVQNFINLI